MKKKLNILVLRWALLLVISLSVSAVVAQDIDGGENDFEYLDSIEPKEGVDMAELSLPDPKSVTSSYEYDPATNKYIYRKTVGDSDFDIDAPLVLTAREYDKRARQESMKAYFREKINAIDENVADEEAKKDLLPTYYIRSGLFESIFGSNTIDIKPIGSVEVDLGMRYTKQDNPILSPKNRVNRVFDFDQRISLSMLGKVGTRLDVNVNYDTESTFAFQNLFKLEYTPTEDDIVQKIEIGNVSMPLSSSLIRGAQSLFGFKTVLQFGNTTVTGVFSEQKSQTKTVVAEGGGTVQEFDLFALDYDADRHFFLSQYFRNRYDWSLEQYPLINSRVQITRVEVWVTNRQNRVTSQDNNMRNIVALQDLGEAQLTSLGSNTLIPDNDIVNFDGIASDFFLVAPNSPVDNKNNKFNPLLIDPNQEAENNVDSYLDSDIRDIGNVEEGFQNTLNINEGADYAKLENARKLTSSEFTYHPQLGYISLSQRLTNDEVLAVAYEYTVGGEVFQVGEFGNDGVEATTVVTDEGTGEDAVSSQALVLKMLKSNLTDVDQPVWNLMMKNIYQIPGAYQLSQEDFKLNIVYTDPSPLNYISPVTGDVFPADVGITDSRDYAVTNKPLLKVFNMDRLNFNNDPETGGDGFFDFVPGLTVDSQYGRVIFTTVEPFGKTLFEKLKENNATEDYLDDDTYNVNQDKYVFKEMYSGTQAGSLQTNQKNKFQLKGKFSSTGGNGIPLGAFNVPQGSVLVKAGGRVLTEGIDYTVNYQAGRVQILDPSLEASNIPIEVSVENNSIFGQQSRRFSGVNIEHAFSEDFIIGGTFLNLNEKPFTQKSSLGAPPVNNSIYGLNAIYSTEVPFLTRMVNKYPTIETEVPSSIAVKGEVAFLKPSTPKGDDFEGESTVYVDDFEGSQSSIDMSGITAWTPASTPVGFGGEDANGSLTYGDKRGKVAWYSIDPVFYSQRPGDVSDAMVSLNKTRQILSRELFPEQDIATGQLNTIFTFDVSYFPNERGMYNYNPATLSDNTLPNPSENWGGMMRSINTTDFQRANVEYIQFWVMDPYFDSEGAVGIETASTNVGKVIFNLGEISEDVLKDGRKQYENGLPADGGTLNTTETTWGKVPSTQSLIYAFDVDENSRTNQDVGFDGLNNNEEANLNPSFATFQDPAGDDYQYFLNTTGDVIQRYKNYNGTDGNSPLTFTDTNRGATTLPDTEDVNRDNTMNTINAYYEYEFEMKPNPVVGENFVTSIRSSDDPTIGNIETPDGLNKKVRWVQYKIPVFEPTDEIKNNTREGRPNPEEVNLNSIRFMRMYLTGFNEDITLRFGSLELVRGDWRRFDTALESGVNHTETAAFEASVVNVIENNSRLPIPYVVPPGVQREQLTTNNTLINQDEQSLALNFCDLAREDSRGVFKATSLDMRQYNRLKMFIHAEFSDIGVNVDNTTGDIVAFVRFGNDLTDNFYHVEIPLNATRHNDVFADQVWPAQNNMDLLLEDLTKLKLASFSDAAYTDKSQIYFANGQASTDRIDQMRIGIKGNPDFGNIRNLMVGVKNNSQLNSDICGEVWFNELRLSGLDNEGGMAALMSMDANMADLATVSATGSMSTIGFGALEQAPNERAREEALQYDLVTNINLGKLLPQNFRLNVPLNVATGEEFITPEYDPQYADVKLDVVKDDASNNSQAILDRAIDYTKRKSYSLIGVRKERGPDKKKRIYDIENLTLNYSYSEMQHHDYEIESLEEQKLKAGGDYTYSFESKPIEPFKKNKFFSKRPYLKLLQDINFNYLPDNISASAGLLRDMNRQQFRQVDVAGIDLDPLYRRNFGTNYNYVINYSLTKSLKLNYNVSNDNVVRNYLDNKGRSIEDYTIWNDFLSIGAPNNHKQSFRLNYDLPINKIPVLKFVKSTYAYTSNFDWRKSSNALSSVTAADGLTYQLGNTIQNANTHTLNSTFDMKRFYKSLGYKKKKKKRKKSASSFAAPPSGAPTDKKKDPEKDQENNKKGFGRKFLDGTLGVLTSVKNININYSENNGTVLPGYLPSIGIFGTSKPGLGYVFGSQDDIRYQMASNNYLTTYSEFNQNYTQVKAKTLNMTASVDLIPDFKIEVIANRLKSDNFSEQYNVQDGEYLPQSPYSSGNYSISTVLIRTSFDGSTDTFSKSFEAFKSNRLIIANRMAEQYYGTTNYPRYDDPSSTNETHAKNIGYPVGFGKNSQDVLIPSLLAAYSGSDANTYSTNTFKNLPLPNWTVKYTGLMKIKWFKDTFKRFSLHHGYKSTYTINSYRSNFEYDNNPGGINPVSGDVHSEYLISDINLIEQFNPLIRADFELKGSFKFLTEVKKDRSMSLSFDNGLLTDVQGLEYTVGLGYRIKDVSFSSKYAGNGTGIVKSDINLKADFSLRNNKTVIRYLDVVGNDRLSGGQNIWSLKVTADYAFSKSLTAIFFYDHSFSKAVISTSYPMTNIRSGITIRYNFGN